MLINLYELKKKTLVEALIFASPKPEPARQIAKIAGVDQEKVKGIVEELNSEFHRSGKPYSIRELADGCAFHLSANYSHFVEEFLGKKALLV